MFLNTPYWNLDLIFEDFIDSFNLKNTWYNSIKQKSFCSMSSYDAASNASSLIILSYNFCI
jgi:hypothetical protein